MRFDIGVLPGGQLSLPVEQQTHRWHAHTLQPREGYPQQAAEQQFIQTPM